MESTAHAEPHRFTAHGERQVHGAVNEHEVVELVAGHGGGVRLVEVDDACTRAAGVRRGKNLAVSDLRVRTLGNAIKCEPGSYSK